MGVILAAQRQILMLEGHTAWRAGQLKSVAEVMSNLSSVAGDAAMRNRIEAALAQALSEGQSGPLLAWLDANEQKFFTAARFGFFRESQ